MQCMLVTLSKATIIFIAVEIFISIT